ncbi:MAG: aspartate kinase [Bacteroidales bacterium]|jgi:aspartate kinase|nr:aspartate kinase [Bacteroidales bacterium]
MKVFKFGGGILHSAEAVKKIPGIISMYPDEPLLVVISAFGKTTNALEEVILSRFRKEQQVQELVGNIKKYHTEILSGLFPDQGHPVYTETGTLWEELDRALLSEPPALFHEFYDRVICYGELISSKIVSHFLAGAGLGNTWKDVRLILKTDSNFRDAAVDWEASQQNADTEIRPLLEHESTSRPLVVTQGFIGSDPQGRSTSLGREGSDYTASIFASLLDASEVITWKDVPGILNADPKHFRQTIKLNRISYAEATELAYYGAKVIHPKTVKPLQNKSIPLQVRSFLEPGTPGTLIHAEAGPESAIPSFIFKFDQVLVSVSSRDLSFINEIVFNDVFVLLSRFSIHMNIIQNSALTLSFCVDNHPGIGSLITALQENYTVRYNDNLELITIRHFNEKASELVLQGKQVILEQQNRTVVQYVVR